MKRVSLLSIVFFLLSFAGMTQNALPEYKVKKSVPVEGDGFWDYLIADSVRHRLFISHGTCVDVLDLKTMKKTGQIPGTTGVHGIALAYEFGKGFVSAGKLDTVIVFDLKTLAITGRIPVGKNPDAIIYDTVSKRVFAFNARGNSVTAIDAATNEVAGTLSFRSNPEYAVADGKGGIYVNLESMSALAKFDAKTLEMITLFPMGPGKEPTGLAIDRENSRVFSACGESNELMIIDVEHWDTIAFLPIGWHCDGDYFLKKTKEVLTSNGEGTITVFHQDSPNHYRKTQTLVTVKGARTITCDESTGLFYLPVADVKMENEKRVIIPGTFRILVIGR